MVDIPQLSIALTIVSETSIQEQAYSQEFFANRRHSIDGQAANAILQFVSHIIQGRHIALLNCVGRMMRLMGSPP